MVDGAGGDVGVVGIDGVVVTGRASTFVTGLVPSVSESEPPVSEESLLQDRVNNKSSKNIFFIEPESRRHHNINPEGKIIRKTGSILF